MQNASQQSGSDPYWTHSGNLSIRTMPARSMAEFASGECSPMYVLLEDGMATLVDVLTNERSAYASSEAACAEADRRAAALLNDRDFRMLSEAGLAAEEWRFCNQGRFLWFQSIREPRIRLERGMGRNWIVMNDRETIGLAATPLAASRIAEELIIWKGRTQ